MVAGFLISALGGSRVQIGGPTGAFVVIVAGIIAKFGISGLLMVTLMAGCLLVLMGVTGLGTAVKFIPRPVTIGFTNGIALLIASTQVKDFLGLTTPAVPSNFLGRMSILLAHIGTADWPTVIVAVTSLAVILLLPRLTRRVPGSIVALLLGTAAVRRAGTCPSRPSAPSSAAFPRACRPFAVPAFSRRLDPATVPLCADGRPPRGGGKPPVGGGGRRHER